VLAVLQQDGKLTELKEAAATKKLLKKANATAKAAKAEAARNYKRLCAARPEPLREMQIRAEQLGGWLAKPQFTADPQGAFHAMLGAPGGLPNDAPAPVSGQRASVV
jgi:hypothetical protein